ncbi:type VI secretion system accessory protein TagJ [Reyranella sp.]|uniref:type VI secretion system accessory protein TagJ n=1 Tax=Reyranella sp. TaxID=1929291 RepID=UPI003D0E0AA4
MSFSSADSANTGDASRLFREGNLADALTAATAAVKRAPTDIRSRVLLAELLAFSGNFDRADVLLDAAAELEPATAIVVAEFRQLLRGALARSQLFSDGRVPEFLGEPTAAQRSSLAAIVALRNGDAAEAARLVAQAEQDRPHPTGVARGLPFDDMRDADDLLASCFEVITTTGKYFWIAPERVLTLEFHAPKRPRDLFLRRATIQVASGPDGDVYVPVIYPPAKSAATTMTDALRLGRATDWQPAGDGGPTVGLGAVTIMVGDDALTWLEIDSIAFEVAS